jgi:hypothetical protein
MRSIAIAANMTGQVPAWTLGMKAKNGHALSSLD